MKDKEITLYDGLNDFMRLSSEFSVLGSATVFSLLTTQFPFLTVFIGLCMPMMINIVGTLDQRRAQELLSDLTDNYDTLNQEVIRSAEFAAFYRDAAETYVKEVSEKKRKILRKLIVNVAVNPWDHSDAHNRVLDVLRRISPTQYLALVDIARAVHGAMKWDREHHGKITFQYGIGVILNHLNLNKDNLNLKSLLRERSLDLELRYLDNMNLIITKDTSLSTLGGGATDLQITHVTPLGHQLIRYVSPEIAIELLTGNNSTEMHEKTI